MEREFTFGQVLELTGASRSQVTHLTARGVVESDVRPAGGTGHHRRFSAYNLFEIAVAIDLAQVGVQHYGVAQALRALRWLQGDPRGNESWLETADRSRRGETRRKLDPKLTEAADAAWQRLWSVTPRDAEAIQGLDASERAWVEHFWTRHAEVVAEHGANTFETLRAIQGILRERPDVQAEAESFERFKDPARRSLESRLVVSPETVREYKVLAPAKSRPGLRTKAVTVQIWRPYFSDSTHQLGAMLDDLSPAIVVDIWMLATVLEKKLGGPLFDGAEIRAEAGKA